jgi:hypothetical protein
MIERLAETPARVRAMLEGICEESLSYKPSDDVFSLRENVMHLRDIDIEGYEKRVILLLTEENPVLPEIDGAALARERDYNNQQIGPALEAFEASRARSIARLLCHPERERGDWPADGGHPAAQIPRSARDDMKKLLERWIEHDAGHIADIEALLAGRAARRISDAA